MSANNYYQRAILEVIDEYCEGYDLSNVLDSLSSASVSHIRELIQRERTDDIVVESFKFTELMAFLSKLYELIGPAQREQSEQANPQTSKN